MYVKFYKFSIYIGALLLFVNCGGSASTNGEVDVSTPESPNILLIIADDLGKDAISGYIEGDIKPNTPNLDEIGTTGLTFNNLWVSPLCTPTRAAMITGKYGYRTGIKSTDDELDPSEQTIQRFISEKTNNKYATAIVGKWGLSGIDTSINPESRGIDYYAGLLFGKVKSYYNWQLTEDGTNSTSTEYTTKKFTDLAIDWIQQQEKPWFMWLAYNAPHTPYNAPPSSMHSQGDLPSYTDGLDQMPYYMAAIEAMDYQIGQLLDNIPAEERENTVIIFIGDNGSPKQVAQFPYSNTTSKGTLYQGGINTPMFISGAKVSRIGTDNNLISCTDLFATIAELAGISVKEINDSKSFKSLLSNNTQIRDFQYSEMNDGTTDAWTISNGEYKLIVNANGNKELYDLIRDPYEDDELLIGSLTPEEENEKMSLEEELLNIRN